MSAFWHWFVIVITVGSMAGCLWLLFANAKGSPGEDTGHVWDDDLRERNNPLPRWWLNLFVITVVFGAAYLVFYPGLGNFAGTLGWTQGAQAQAALDQVNAQRGARHAQFQGRDFTSLAGDPAARAMGREIFLRNCAGCHGADARGAIGFPNLADDDWLYGGSFDKIHQTITGGRRGYMPTFNEVLSAEQIDQLANYVASLSGTEHDAAKATAGRALFTGEAAACYFCHVTDAKGRTEIGAPNLTDNIWLWVDAPAGTGAAAKVGAIRSVIANGVNKGVMPAWGDRLTPEQIKVLTVYVHELGGGQ